MLDLLDLDIPSLGYTRFISAWLYKGPEGVFLVDPGPACTIDDLCRQLAERGVERLDWILLTHIHMDHAGGIGHLAERYPEARILCHEKAVPHLIDPSRLWQGSLKTLGRVAEVYGRIRPVAEHRITSTGKIDFGEGIRAIDTPGHASHHLGFVFADWLFCGELFGVHQELADDFYLRPATPPRFSAEAFFASMDRVAPETERRVCFAHHGSHPDGRKIAELARQQLKLWIEVISEHAENPDFEAITRALAQRDPLFARFNMLDEQARERERFFVQNSVDGILGWLQSK